MALLKFDAAGALKATYPNLPFAAAPSEGRNIAIDPTGNIWIASSRPSGPGVLIEALGLATGPQYFRTLGRNSRTDRPD